MESQIIKYEKDNNVTIDVYIKNNDLWLSIAQIAELFGTTKILVNKHLKQLFDKGELSEDKVTQIFISEVNGKQIQLSFYNLDVIIYVGSCINSNDLKLFKNWINANFLENSNKNNAHIYYKKLYIENIRTFGKGQEINLNDKNNKPYMWNVIIGDNGIGKTSILKSLALPLIQLWGNPDWNWNFKLKTYERYNSQDPKIEIDFEYNNEIQKIEDSLLINVLISKNNLQHTFKNTNINSLEQSVIEKYYKDSFVLFAYGASRHIGIKGLSAENDFSAQTLFDDSATLLNTEEWLIQSEFIANKDDKKYKKYNQKVISIIKLLLKDEIFDIKIDIINNIPKVLFKTNFGWVSLHELSLGYKTLLSWVVDFVKGMLEKYPESKNALAEPAICLVDEIDLHIHPSLQNKVIQFLSQTFPKTQFIVTAHSPLIVQALENANIILLKEKGNSVEVLQNILDIRNWRVDQILMSDLFGLQDVYSLETQLKLERREKLINKDSLTEKENIELIELNIFAENLPLGNSQNEIEGFNLIRQFAQKIAQNQK